MATLGRDTKSVPEAHAAEAACVALMSRNVVDATLPAAPTSQVWCTEIIEHAGF